MKKTYMKPVLELVKLETQHMIAASPGTSGVSLCSDTEANEAAYSKNSSEDMWHWMDDGQK